MSSVRKTVAYVRVEVTVTLTYETEIDRYLVPNIHEFSSYLTGSTNFSRMDLVKAFNQIPVHPDDIPHFGIFDCARMPFA